MNTHLIDCWDGPVVVGSGASALAAVWALQDIDKENILLIDSGDLELTASRQFGSHGKEKLAAKMLFGSDAMYRYPSQGDVEFVSDDRIAISSFLGGLTSVWGANLQVYKGIEMGLGEDDSRSLSEGYSAVLKRMPFVCRRDDLNERFPWPEKFQSLHPASTRIDQILNRKSADHQSSLIGYSRNATYPPQLGCTMCGECLNGCGVNAIFSARDEIRSLIALDAVNYLQLTVETILVENHHVSLMCSSKDRKIRKEIKCKKVFLGAGSIASTLILSRSGLIPNHVTLDDTQVFYLPFVTGMSRDKKASANSYSLAQAFVASTKSDDEDFHISLYETESSWKNRAVNEVGAIAKLLPNFAFNHMLAGIGFLPSSRSGKIEVFRTNAGVLRVQFFNPNANAVATRLDEIVDTVNSLLKGSRTRAIRTLVRTPHVGASFHSGVLRSGLSTERLVSNKGELEGLRDVKIIDGSALPHLPAGPVTLTMMANSYRIARCSL